MSAWQTYSNKFLAITPREQMLILLTGLVLIVFGLFNFVVEGQIVKIRAVNKQIQQLTTSNNSASQTIQVLEQALAKDPNQLTNEQIAQYQQKLASVDQQLLALTSDLIDPIQMRHALVQLLKLERGVTLESFQLVGATPIDLTPASSAANKDVSATDAKDPQSITNKSPADVESLVLYRHGIKLKLTGSYFKLRDYLAQLEQLSWKFFWQEFDYKLKQYPVSELEIQIYSLSTKQEFVGV